MKKQAEKSLDDVMICPNCESDDCYTYSTDEIEFSANCTGHYYVDCHCKNCGRNFRLYAEFNYSVTKSDAR
jgi:hypothetical protein